MRKSFVRTGLLCSSLVMLSGCYSNGKFHSPTWNDMAFWKKDKAPDTSLAAAPSVTRPSDEALADKGSPGAKAATAPPYEAAAATYNSANSGASRNPEARYPESTYPDTGYPATGAPASTGGTNWAANGNTAAVSTASNPYAKSGGGYDTGSKYDGRAADHAQTTPYDSAYPGAGGTYSARNTANDAGSRPYSANQGSSGGDRSGYDRGGYGAADAATAPGGPRNNPYYSGEAAPAGGSQYNGSQYNGAPSSSPYDEGAYKSPDRYAPPASQPTNDKYTQPGYASPQDSAQRFNSEGYRGMTGDRYANDPSRADSAAKAAPANTFDARTADSRNTDQARSANEYKPGDTGYQPKGVAAYEMPTVDGRSTRTAEPYQPGGTSRYDSPSSRTATTGGGTDGAPSSYGNNPYAAPTNTDRYQEPASDTRRY